MTITGTAISGINVAALPRGKAVFNNYMWYNDTDQVLKIDSQGRVTQVIYSCVGCPSSIYGLLVLGDYLYFVHGNGTVIQTGLYDNSVLCRYTSPDVSRSRVIHSGSMYSRPDKIPDSESLLLCDDNKAEVFTFKLSTGEKQVHISGLNGPTSVSYFFKDNMTYYIICESLNHSINVYNATWHLVRRIGRKGSDDGELNYPGAAIVSDEDTIIILDQENYRVSEFSFDGTFLRHIFHVSDGIDRPGHISYYYPHLWLDNGNANLRRYKLY